MIDENPVIFQNRRNQYMAGVVHVPWEVPNPPILIMAHGFTDDKVCDNRLFVRFSRQARAKGFAVLRFDFAGSGDSEGDFADMTLTKEIGDLECIMDFAYTIPCLMDSPIYLIGYSLGAAVALSVAARNETVRGVVGWAPVSDLQAVFRSLLGEEAFVTARMQQEVPCRNDLKQFYMKSSFFRDLHKHHPMQDIAKLAPRPVLLVQGTADTKVLPEQTRGLFLSASGPKELHMVDNAPHSFALHEEELFSITLSHLRTWNRDAWYAPDEDRSGTPNKNLHPTGRA